MTQWMIDHDNEAEQIARRGKLWMKDLLFHGQAKQDERAINNEIFRRYRLLFDDQSNVESFQR